MDVTFIKDIAAGAAALASFPGTFELGILTGAGLLPRRARRTLPIAHRTRMAVVIPAHNERENIGRCLDTLLAANAGGEATIVVVADNCTDETASIARRKGVEAMERFSSSERGKGFALAFAFERLEERGYDAYIVVDADSEVPADFLAAFSEAFSEGADALQCPYLVLNSDINSRTRLLDLALRGFNLVRPLGRSRLRLSAGILGNGFALRRKVLERVPYNAHSVVEDLEYHLALVDHGFRVDFLENTCVRGAMPAAGRGRETQRARWEGGRFRMLREYAIALARKVREGRWQAVEPLLDLLLLPLGFHVLLLFAASFDAQPVIRGAGVLGLAIVSFHIAAAIGRGSSVRRDLGALATAPLYVLWKMAKLPAIFMASTRTAGWVRTERTAAARENL